MEDAYEETLDEIKRAEHLYYVSLKYTRTVDVIRSCMDRFINTYENGFKTLLLYAKKKKKIKEIPESAVLQIKELKGLTLFEDMKLANYIEMHARLRKLMRRPFTKREEFRRHVTMIVEVEDGHEEINIDIIGVYYHQAFEFLKKLKDVVEN